MGRSGEKWQEQALVLGLAFLVSAFALVECTGVDGEGKGGPAEPDPVTGKTGLPLLTERTGDSGSGQGSSPDGSWHYGWGWGAAPGGNGGGGFGFGYGGGSGGGGGGGSGGAFGFGSGGGHHSEGDGAGYHGSFGGVVSSRRGLFRGVRTAPKDGGGNN